MRRVMRANPGRPEALREAIVNAIQFKPKSHEFDLAAPVKGMPLRTRDDVAAGEPAGSGAAGKSGGGGNRP